jgi:transcription initiation factor IIF auxiliary subunit
MNSPEFASFSRFSGTKEGHRLYAWCVFVDMDRENLKKIREVEYTLHPSFADPVRTVSDATNCFALLSQGWGEFQLRTRISFADGSVIRKAFHLKLKDDGWPRGDPPPATANAPMRAIYGALLEEEWDWRRISTLARRAKLSIEQTQAYLADMARARTVRKAYYLSLDNQELWGATSRVGLLPEPK